MLTPGGGTYAQAQSVTITDATPFATIHYTVDGSTPTEASPVYKQLISGLASGSKIRAIATAMFRAPSVEASGMYIWTGATLLAAKPPEPSAYDLGKSAYDTQARTLFTQACDGVNMNACTYLGYIYANGLGIPPDADMARKIYQKSCDGGHLRGCTGLGTVYQEAGDINNARKYFKLACDGGVKDACEYLRDVQ